MNEQAESKITQYCRYCAFCIYGDVPYCTDHGDVLTDKGIRQVNHCKEFALSALGDVITGRKYTPRKGKPLKPDEVEQLRFEI